MRRTAPTLLLLLLAALAAPAQSGQPAPPEVVADAYLSASFAGDWAKCASLMHPEALAQLKAFFTPLLKQDGAEPSRRLIFKVSTPAEVDALPAAAFYERLLSFIEENVEDYAQTLRASEGAVVGTVAEGEDFRHVVYRVNTKLPDVTLTKLDVLSLRRDGASWRVMPSADLERLASALALKVESESQPPPPKPRPAPRRPRAKRP